MAYTFKNSYNLNVLAGYGGNTDYDADTNLARCTAVAEWINTNLGDIFEASTGTYSTTDTFCYIYYKGTNSGFMIKCYTNTTAGTSYNSGQLMHNGTSISIFGACLCYSQINLLVVKSKYGVIAGIYYNNLSAGVITLGVNNFDGTFVTIIPYQTTIYTSSVIGAENSCTSSLRGTSEKVVFGAINVPGQDTVTDGIYQSTGAYVSNAGIFTVEGGTDMFCELPRNSSYVNYAGYALKLEEPEEGDYIFSETSTAETTSEDSSDDDTTDDTE